MNKYLFVILSTLVLMVSFTATAVAAGAVVPDDTTLMDLLRPVLDAAMHGQGYLAAALVLVFMAAVARRYGGRYWGFLNTDVGGALTVLVGSYGGAAAAALTGGAPASWDTAYRALVIAVSASGGYSLVKRLLVEPVLRPLAARYTFLQPVLAVVLWVFNKPDPIAGAATPRPQIRDHRTH